MRLSEFKADAETGVRIPPESSKRTPAFQYSDGTTEENKVLNAVTTATDLRDNTQAFRPFIDDWPSYYHLSPGRSNAVRALALPHDIRVLELGAGCGALARHLGENHATVHSVEGSGRRAAICRARCRDLANVDVFHADFSNLSFDAEYDVVLLNGVLEYAPSFFRGSGSDGTDPVDALLRLAKSALKPGGIVLVAIENKIGLKYWAGAPEDHTSTTYEGIHGYPATTKVATFSKDELREVLTRAGFPAISFFYCFPDYKFASTVLSDPLPPRTYLYNWLDFPAECPGLERGYTIHEGLAAKTMYEAGLLGAFANSFLVVAGAEQAVSRFPELFQPPWIAKRLSVRGRDSHHHRVTSLARQGSELIVTKAGVNYGHGTALEPAVTSPWTPGELLLLEMSRAMLGAKPDDAVHALLAEYHGALLNRFQSTERDAEGYPLLQPICIDFLMRNLIRGPEGLVAIDLEWQALQPVSADFMLFRSLWNDVIVPNHAWASRRIADFDHYIVQMIQRIYPAYGFARQARNRALEDRFLADVSLSSSEGVGQGDAPLWMASKAWGRILAKRLRDRVGRS